MVAYLSSNLLDFGGLTIFRRKVSCLQSQNDLLVVPSMFSSISGMVFFNLTGWLPFQTLLVDWLYLKIGEHAPKWQFRWNLLGID
jgi:hypothetical protein